MNIKIGRLERQLSPLDPEIDKEQINRIKTAIQAYQTRCVKTLAVMIQKLRLVDMESDLQG